MFDVSFSELLIIGVIALVVIGPERLPKVAKTVGHLLGRAQRYVNDVKADIQREIELDELRKFKSEMDEAAQSMHSSLRETENSIRGSAEALKSDLHQTAHSATESITGTSPPPADGAADTPPLATPLYGQTAATTPPSATPAATPPAVASSATPGAEPSAQPHPAPPIGKQK